MIETNSPQDRKFTGETLNPQFTQFDSSEENLHYHGVMDI